MVFSNWVRVNDVRCDKKKIKTDYLNNYHKILGVKNFV